MWGMNDAKRARPPLHWRHNDHGGVSNHQPHGCLTQSLIQAQIKENIKAPRHWPLCGEFTRICEFPAQKASNAGNVSIWWRHHEHINAKWAFAFKPRGAWSSTSWCVSICFYLYRPCWTPGKCLMNFLYLGNVRKCFAKILRPPSKQIHDDLFQWLN